MESDGDTQGYAPGGVPADDTGTPAGAGASSAHDSPRDNLMPDAVIGTAQPDRRDPNFFARLIGMDPGDPQGNRVTRASLGAGLASVANNWSKPAIAAFAGGAGASLQGAEAGRQQQDTQLRDLLSVAIRARQIGDMDSFRRASQAIQQIAQTRGQPGLPQIPAIAPTGQTGGPPQPNAGAATGVSTMPARAAAPFPSAGAPLFAAGAPPIHDRFSTSTGAPGFVIPAQQGAVPPAGPVSAPRSATPGADVAAAPRLPDIGQVQKGYRYIGGDPARRESWAEVRP